MKKTILFFIILIPFLSMGQASKISALADGSATINGTEYFPIAKSGLNYKVSLNGLRTWLAGSIAPFQVGFTDHIGLPIAALSTSQFYVESGANNNGINVASNDSGNTISAIIGQIGSSVLGTVYGFGVKAAVSGYSAGQYVPCLRARIVGDAVGLAVNTLEADSNPDSWPVYISYSHAGGSGSTPYTKDCDKAIVTIEKDDFFRGAHDHTGSLLDMGDGTRSTGDIISTRGNADTITYTTHPLFYVKYDGKTGIGTATPSQMLQVHGMIYSDTLGFKFPDGSIQTTASSGASFDSAHEYTKLFIDTISRHLGTVFFDASNITLPCANNVDVITYLSQANIGDTHPFLFAGHKDSTYSFGHVYEAATGDYLIERSTSGSWITPATMRITRALGNIGIFGAPVASAALDINSTTQGFLPPRMTAAQASAISSPAEGLMVYVTDTSGTFTAKGWWGWDGAAWQKLNN